MFSGEHEGWNSGQQEVTEIEMSPPACGGPGWLAEEGNKERAGAGSCWTGLGLAPSFSHCVHRKSRNPQTLLSTENLFVLKSELVSQAHEAAVPR